MDHFDCLEQELRWLVLRSPVEEALEDDSGANMSLSGATSGGADGYTSN